MLIQFSHKEKHNFLTSEIICAKNLLRNEFNLFLVLSEGVLRHEYKYGVVYGMRIEWICRSFINP